jgi:hypothetical protein
VYPDPVRVVSVGKPVEELLADPSSKENADYSVEFCGGTHLLHTNQAGRFALISEEGIAKVAHRLACKMLVLSRLLERGVDWQLQFWGRRAQIKPVLLKLFAVWLALQSVSSAKRLQSETVLDFSQDGRGQSHQSRRRLSAAVPVWDMDTATGSQTKPVDP